MALGLAAALVLLLVAAIPARAADDCPNAVVRAQQGISDRPDCRAFEQVTPQWKNGVTFSYGLGGTQGTWFPPQLVVATSGDQVMVQVGGPTFDDRHGANATGTSLSITRDPLRGWQSLGVTPVVPLQDTPPVPQSYFLSRAWNSDLSRSVVMSQVRLAAGDEDGRSTGDLFWRDGDGHFELITCAPGASCTKATAITSAVVSSGMDAVAFAATESLVPGAPVTSQVYLRVKNSERDDLRWLSQGSPLLGGAALGSTASILVGAAPYGVSDGGSHVFFASPATGSSRLYAWIDGDLFEVSRSRTGGSSNGKFMAASRDGNIVYFSSTAALTSDDTNSVEDLYVWRFDPSTGTDTLTRVAGLTVDGGGRSPNNPGPGAGTAPANSRFLTVIGASDDGERVYFTVGSGASGEVAPARGDLYLAENAGRADARLRWIAQVNQGGTATNIGCLGSAQSAICARVTASGRYLSFDSRMPLTVDDRDTDGTNTCTPASIPASGPGSTVIPAWCRVDAFRYDADFDDGAGRLERVSTGVSGGGDARGNGQADASVLVGLQFSTRPAGMTEDGTVYFETDEQLDRRDRNHQIDVYEQSPSSGTTSLISGGRADANAPSKFAYNTPDRSSVIFVTTDPLVADDVDGSTDYYVARSRGGFPIEEVGECLPDAGTCQGSAPPPPQLPILGSVSLAGEGNQRTRKGSRSTVRVKGLRPISGPAGTLRVKVGNGGRISVAGPRIRRAAKSVPGAGTYVVRVALKPDARKQLRNRGVLRGKARVVFRARGGKESARAVAVTFRWPKAPKANSERGSR